MVYNGSFYGSLGFRSGQCRICHKYVPFLAGAFGICPDCLKKFPGEAWLQASCVHRAAREGYGLPVEVPRSEEGLRCSMCLHQCLIAEGEKGFCGLRENRQGKMVVHAGNPSRGHLQVYVGSTRSKCVAGVVCPGGFRENQKCLAVFYGSCTFNCLFCQNWNHRIMKPDKMVGAEELAASVDGDTACVCFLGGDPGSQMPHALATARRLVDKGVRICWETNGSMHPRLLEKAIRISLATGGCIKFDLKAWNKYLHQVLTGTGNEWSLENFRRAASYASLRPDPPLIVASTLLVPGYIDLEEIYNIAGFIYRLNPRIPYVLLGFCPNFYLGDLPSTSVRHAREAIDTAKAAGLENIYLVNEHLLTRTY